MQTAGADPAHLESGASRSLGRKECIVCMADFVVLVHLVCCAKCSFLIKEAPECPICRLSIRDVGRFH